MSRLETQSQHSEVLRRTLDHALGYLDSLPTRKIAARASLNELRNSIGRPLPEIGLDAVSVIDDLVADVEGGLLGNASGRFFAWVIGGAVPASVAADWLTSTWDQNSGMYSVAPAETVVEEVCGRWLLELLGLPVSVSFALVTGCQMAHVTCLAAARNALLAKRGWDVERDGLNGAPALRILCNGDRHGSVDRAVRLLGLGTAVMVNLPVDDDGRLGVETLRAALESDSDTATIVLLQAGDINTGAYDPFATLIPLAHSQEAWVHVDGAFGLWAGASPKLHHLVKGVEQADSWATDGHKWLNVPFDCGYAFVADSEAHYRTMSHRASYLTHSQEARDQIDWNPEYSRRGRGFATYAAIRQMGKNGIADLIERTCGHARSLVNQIGVLSGAEVLWEPSINQGLVRFRSPKPGATDSDHDQHTEEVAAAVRKAGEAFFQTTTWRGHRCMRVSVCNWQTNDSDVERAVRSVADCLESLRTL
ncbi:MAG: aminotransferase class V-fold PLP-dependent enzyme [Verrucomicrobiales bacterium]|jgi:glutamate/tyrosine decarboxylase-like PLP-dependent enzyme|nr:aminotransferase class V-fold PLP-dependent enzyme [Verrucomicrobiales bacterium]MDF1784572.1 aminotransferase class V-fold PLP-dependent enzyme [Verrucomicrobiales bacterium]